MIVRSMRSCIWSMCCHIIGYNIEWWIHGTKPCLPPRNISIACVFGNDRIQLYFRVLNRTLRNKLITIELTVKTAHWNWHASPVWGVTGKINLYMNRREMIHMVKSYRWHIEYLWYWRLSKFLDCSVNSYIWTVVDCQFPDSIMCCRTIHDRWPG